MVYICCGPIEVEQLARSFLSNGVLAITSRVIATSFALISFAAALFVGILADNPLKTIIGRALFVMIFSYVIGSIIGAIAHRTVQLHIERHKRVNPIPGEEASGASDTGTHLDTAGKNSSPAAAA